MTKTAYPDYIEILKLRKAHPIYQIAALILGIDPRTLKLMPDYHAGKAEWEYLPDSKNHMYLPVKATKMPLEEYLLSETVNRTQVPLLNLPDDLGEYTPSMADVLYQELKTALLGATKAKEISCVIPGSIAEERYLEMVSENTLIKSESVRTWLTAHSFNTPFFDKQMTHDGIASLFDKNHSNYSPELAIAVEAWMRFSDLGISHPKKYIQNWLNAAYPNPNDKTEDSVGTFVSAKAKERITTLVNWNSEGGVNTKAYNTSLYALGVAKKVPRSES